MFTFSEGHLSGLSTTLLSFHKSGDSMGLCVIGFENQDSLKNAYYHAIETMIDARYYEMDWAFQLELWGDALAEVLEKYPFGEPGAYVTERCIATDSTLVYQQMDNDYRLYSQK